MTARSRSFPTATILSIITIDGARNPFSGDGKITGRNAGVASISDDVGQMMTVGLSGPNSSA
jgi:hypothetical protein